MLNKYVRDIELFNTYYRVVDEEDACIAEKLLRKYFNRDKLLVISWTTRNITINLPHFFDNINDNIIHSLVNDPEYHIVFQTDAEGWNMQQFYVPLCASASAYGIPFSKLVFITANLDIAKEYRNYSARTRFEPDVKLIAYNHFLVAMAQDLDFVAETYNKKIKFTLNDPEKYFDQMYKKKLKQNPNNVFLHLSRICRDHRIMFNYLIDHKNTYKNYYSLSQDYIAKTSLQIMSKKHYNIDYDDILSWSKKLPLHVDTTKFLFNYGLFDITYLKLYSKYLINIAGETNWSSNLFYSEKTFKPIGAMMPFLVYGNVGINKALTNYGFKLYESLFDYSWDDEFDNVMRIELLVDMCTKLAARLEKYSWKEKVDVIMLGQKDVIIHNYETLLKQNDVLEQKIVTINL